MDSTRQKISTPGSGPQNQYPIAPPPAAGADIEFFTSPSGNIGCAIKPGHVRCDIDARNWAPPPRPADCPTQTGYGQGISLRAHGPAEFGCAGDTTLGAGSAPAYGQFHASGGVSCNSEPPGMRCSNSDGSGFTISTESYTLF